MTTKFLVILTRSDGGIVAECPSLPGCFSEGETKQEALENIREAIELSLETREAEGLPAEIAQVEIEEISVVNG
jgi:predicted RNase H-like HicB family nuclease